MNLILTSSLFFCPSILPCLVFVKSAEHFALCFVVFLFTNTKKKKILQHNEALWFSWSTICSKACLFSLRLVGIVNCRNIEEKALTVSSFLCLSAASAASRADEEEPGGSAQGAGGEETRVWGGEGKLGGPAAPGAAEIGGLQVQWSHSLSFFWQTQVFRLLYNTLGDWP